MEPTIETLEARPSAAVRATVQMQEIGNKIGELMPVVMAVAKDSASGPVYARWHCWDEATGDGDMELGVPVAQPLHGAGDVQATELPAGRAAVYWHVGPYDDLKDSWGIVQEWVSAQELTSRGAPWEEYCSDCSVTPPEKLRTRIVWPVE